MRVSDSALPILLEGATLSSLAASSSTGCSLTAAATSGSGALGSSTTWSLLSSFAVASLEGGLSCSSAASSSTFSSLISSGSMPSIGGGTAAWRSASPSYMLLIGITPALDSLIIPPSDVPNMGLCSLRPALKIWLFEWEKERFEVLFPKTEPEL